MHTVESNIIWNWKPIAAQRNQKMLTEENNFTVSQQSTFKVTLIELHIMVT